MLLVVQLVLEVTENDVFPEDEVTAWLDGVTNKVGEAPTWVTVTVTGVKPVTVTVMVATLETIVAFAE